MRFCDIIEEEYDRKDSALRGDGNNMKIKKYIPLSVGAYGLMALMQIASADVDESGKVGANETEGRLDPDYLVDDEIEDEAITSPNGGKVIEIKNLIMQQNLRVN